MKHQVKSYLSDILYLIYHEILVFEQPNHRHLFNLKFFKLLVNNHEYHLGNSDMYSYPSHQIILYLVSTRLFHLYIVYLFFNFFVYFYLLLVPHIHHLILIKFL